mmetsp:Transcript_4455/g.3232  ORF Transcript_4455/g.3232 Transcript_4455/m.3232 type:complete len:129 (-) Transcript_4455:389-775(-)
MAIVICICALLGITASDFINILAQPRLFYLLARDGLFFSVFAELDPKKKVPVKGGWLSCAVMCLISLFLDLETLTGLSNLGCLTNYCLINMELMSIRFRGEDLLKKGEADWTKEKYIVVFVICSLGFS